eukprot:9561311-Lingulodinium_polyedra.AAC.1
MSTGPPVFPFGVLLSESCVRDSSGSSKYVLSGLYKMPRSAYSGSSVLHGIRSPRSVRFWKRPFCVPAGQRLVMD